MRKGAELIDTCWNVNYHVAETFLSNLLELIDTCWNVNYTCLSSEHEHHHGINRYMLECKCRKKISKFLNHARINRYMLECKYDIDKVVERLKKGINRYMLECKCFRRTATLWTHPRINRYMLECKCI